MDWVKPYYTAQSETFARAALTDSHRTIAARLDGWCRARGLGPRVLELGAGMGGTAIALAAHGYDVTAVEFNPSDVALARRLVEAEGAARVRSVEGDFYTVDLDDRFDFVFYWDGFGVGTDTEQRRLLQRIAREWLAPDGVVFLDIFSPWNWMRRAGTTSTHTARDGRRWTRTIGFDVVRSRLTDTWAPEDDHPVGPAARTQSIRCYTIPELALLAAGTGLELETVLAMDGSVIDPDVPDADLSAHLAATNGYYAFLRHAPGPA